MNRSDSPSPVPPPHAQLIQMGTARWVSEIVYAAAKLGIADHLAQAPKSGEEVARELSMHGPSMHRFLRALASLGVVAEREQQRFALTPLGEALRTGAPGAARSTLIAFGGQWFSSGLHELLHSLATGKTGFEKANGMPVFDFLGKHPEEASHFSAAMVGFHGDEPAAVAAACDFSRFGTIVDVGGATGNMLAAILAKYPQPRGVLFDLPHVVRDAAALLTNMGVAARVTIESGSFFESVPAGGDAYLLSHVVHDWSEGQCLTILGNVRKGMRPDGRVFLVEMVLPAGDVPHPGKILDIVMLTIPGGQERTEAEYSALLQKAGFRLVRVIPTGHPVSIVEAELAP